MITKVVSGGQTGIDRAALDVARKLEIPHGGWCPKGRLAEDGPLSEDYSLKETPSAEYTQRTEWNVRDSDGTLIITGGIPTGGTAYTIRKAKDLNKPCLILDLNKAILLQDIKDWIQRHDITVLNIAGPRESQKPGIYNTGLQLITSILKETLSIKQ